MKKLKLDMDALQVDTFTTADSGTGRGTVRGHVTLLHCSTQCDTEGNTCDGGHTCNAEFSCNGEYSCALSCTDCTTNRCDTNVQTCGQFSCVYTCGSCNPYGC